MVLVVDDRCIFVDFDRGIKYGVVGIGLCLIDEIEFVRYVLWWVGYKRKGVEEEFVECRDVEES
ncbi:hypothetical protein [Bacillus pumilus]|uniref:hypothetical protein n=1 Tax=Bacillus pumilus TaxID=1408 RepID=UPI00119C962A|nr:hypothetical protein [Bacillus pumilus]